MSGEKINKRSVTLKPDYFLQDFFVINVYPKTNLLEEVVITNNANISTLSLGIISKDTKSYTPAERKLRTADKFKWYSPLLIPFGGMSVDGLINKISGRTAMLKKELLIERQEHNQQKLRNLFSENFFLTTLKIPAENVNGFLIFATQDDAIMQGIYEKNTIEIRFRLIELSVNYKKSLIAE